MEAISSNIFYRPSYRKIVASQAPYQSSLADAKLIESAGSFTFTRTEKIQNRFIIWRSSGHDLFLEEYSFENTLSNNAVCIHFQNTVLLPGTALFQTLDHTILLVPTLYSVHRLVLPNPNSMKKGLSILNELSANFICDPKSFSPLNNVANINIVPGAVSAIVNSSQEAIFTYGRSDGSICLVTMPKLVASGCSQDILNHSSGLKRLWTGLVRQSESEGNEKVVCLCLQQNDDDVRLHVVYNDYKMRLWSCKKRDLETTFDLLALAPQGVKESTKFAVNAESWIIKVVETRMESYIFLHFYTVEEPRFFILHCKEDSVGKFTYERIMSIEAFENAELIDFLPSSQYLIGIWNSQQEQNLRYLALDLQAKERAKWIDKSIKFSVHFENNNQSITDSIDSIFQPGSFSMETLTKSIKLNCPNFNRSILDQCQANNNMPELKQAFLDYMNRIEKNVNETKSTLHSKSRPAISTDSIVEALKSSLLQYHKAATKINTIFPTPIDKLFGVICQDRLSFVTNVNKSICTILHDNCSEMDIFCSSNFSNSPYVLKCLDLINAWFNLDNESMGRLFIQKVYNEKFPPHETLRQEMFKFISWTSTTCTEFRTYLAKCDRNFVTSFEKLIQTLQPDLSMVRLFGEDVNDFDSSTNQIIFSRENVKHFFSQILRKNVNYRMTTCRNVLLFLETCLQFGEEMKLSDEISSKIESQLLPNLNLLCRFYVAIDWLLNRMESLPENLNDADSSGQFEQLKISSVSQEKSSTISYLMDDLLATELYPIINKCVVKLTDSGKKSFDFWQISSTLIDLSLAFLWPAGEGFMIFEFLFERRQYKHLLTLCDFLNSWCERHRYGRFFIEGQCLLKMDHATQAIDCFRKAFIGIRHEDSSLLQRLGFEQMPLEDICVQYYLKIIELYEERGNDKQIIELCKDGLQETPEGDKNKHLLWTVLFKNYLSVGSYDKSFISMNSNTDYTSRKTCLRLFVVRLLEQKQFRKLISYNFGHLEADFIEIMEHRARNVDIMQENFYNVLGSYFIGRQNFRRAAYYFYELALRYSLEAVHLDTLKNRSRALLSCIQNLNLVRQDYRWILKPIDQKARQATSPKRNYDDEIVLHQNSPQSAQIVTLEELRNELLLVEANQIIAQNTKLFTYLSPEEAISQLCRLKYFDEASQLAIGYDIQLESVFESLVISCLTLTVHKQQHENGQNRKNLDQDWIERNRMLLTSISSEARRVDLAWRILQEYLQHFSTIRPASTLYSTVCAKLLAYNHNLPGWLVEKFRKINLPEFLRLLIIYDKLEEAASVVTDYFQALLTGNALEDFDLKNGLKDAKKRPVLIPYSEVDLLIQLFDETASHDMERLKAKKDLEAKLKEYFEKCKSFVSM